MINNSERTGQVVGLVLAIAIPVLTLMAYRGWTKTLRNELPHWRNVLGLVSIVTTVLSWAVMAMFAVFTVADVRVDFSPDWTAPIGGIVLVGTVGAFALKGAPRIQAIVAGTLTTAAWLTSMVH